MYKKIIFYIVCIAFTAVQSLSAQSIFDKWPELKNFHGVMSQTFHPSEEGNLAPIKSRSGEMREKANLLAKSAIPKEYQTPAIIQAVKKLKKGSKVLHNLVQNKETTDAQLTISLSALHDVFHEIVGLCKHESH